MTPSKDDPRITLRLPPKLMALVKWDAKRNGVSVQKKIQRLVEAWARDQLGAGGE